MAQLVAGSLFNYESIKDTSGKPKFTQNGDTLTVTLSKVLTYQLTAASPGSLSVSADGPVGTIGAWSAAMKGKPYFSLTGINYDIGNSTVYDDGYSDNGVTVRKLAAELAYNLNGDDEIIGSNMNDKLAGFAGNDVINGGLGKDFLLGGSGADVFQFSSFGVANADKIVDFTRGEDKIELAPAVFTELPAALTADMLVVSNKPKALDADDRLIFQSSSGKLYYDADGSEPGKMQLVVQLMGVKTLDISDFVVAEPAP